LFDRPLAHTHRLAGLAPRGPHRPPLRRRLQPRRQYAGHRQLGSIRAGVAAAVVPIPLPPDMWPGAFGRDGLLWMARVAAGRPAVARWIHLATPATAPHTTSSAIAIIK